MGKVFKKVTKPFAKVLDKIVPNEIKPALPYLAAAFPFLAPGMYASMAAGLGNLGFTNPAFIEMAQRGLISGGLNLASQLPQEGAAERGINPLSLALAVGSGALTAPGGADALRGMQSASNLGDIGTETVSRSFLQKAGDFGLEGLAKGSEYLSAAASPEAGFMQAVKGATPGLTFAAGEQAYNTALDAQREFELANQGFQDFTGQQLADFSAGRKAAILASMGRAGFGEDEISATLAQLGLRNGGRVGFEMGGNVSPTDSDEEGMSGVIYYDEEGKPISQKEAMKLFNRQAEEEYRQKNNKAMGGIISLMGGGMPSMEMDYRGGGFIPVGAKERADDVPARLSKNEFVMTADAVRAAGGGSVNEGARRMYELMNNLEARA
jgi:hypothetical protein